MATSQDILGQLQSYQAGAKTPDQAYQEANQALGVSGAQQQVQGLRGAINSTTSLLGQVAPSVMGRTQNSLVTSAQAGRQVQNEQAPIQDNLGKLNTSYNDASQDYKDLEGQAQQRASNTLSGQQNQLSYLQQLYGSVYGQEQDAAKAAEAKRQFDAQLAENQRQANMAASAKAAGGASPSFGSSGTRETAVKLSNDPNAAVSQLFQGYQPGQQQYYTENVVIPQLSAIIRAQAGNSPLSASAINAKAQQLAYNYRKQSFGE